MALRLHLEINDIFYIGEIKIRLCACENIGRKTVTANFDIFYPEGTKSISLVADESFEVISSAFLEIWPKGSAKRNLLSVVVSAPKDIYIKREGYAG